jgi:hypothetical protein
MTRMTRMTRIGTGLRLGSSLARVIDGLERTASLRGFSNHPRYPRFPQEYPQRYAWFRAGERGLTDRLMGVYVCFRYDLSALGRDVPLPLRRNAAGHRAPPDPVRTVHLSSGGYSRPDSGGGLAAVGIDMSTRHSQHMNEFLQQNIETVVQVERSIGKPVN